MGRPPPGSVGWRRRGPLVAVALAVLLAHALVGEWLAQELRAASAGVRDPERMQAAFVRELQPAAPPEIAAALPTPPPPEAQRASPAPIDAAASAPAPERVPEAEAAPERADPPAEAPAEAAAAKASASPQPDAAASEADADTRVAEAAVASAMLADSASATSTAEPASEAAQLPGPRLPSAAVSGAASSPGAVPFEWPPSTRLTYALSGWVRGTVEGTAQVQWLREGERYQVHLDVVIGPSFAPVMQRRMTSDGELTAAGLRPRRYDEVTDIAFNRRRDVSLSFDATGVTLANGRRAERLAGVQDSASQFVQMSFWFRTGARKLEPGALIEMPLALPRRVDRWLYDVVGEETLDTAFGPVPAWHLKPRRIGDANTLWVEAWFAPSLEYLPIRLLIHQGEENFIDLLVERLPEQAAADPATGAASR